MRFAVLVHPTSSRVYGRLAPDLCRQELAALAANAVSDLRTEQIASVPCVTFEAASLDDTLLSKVSNLSGCLALFRREGEALIPVERRTADRFDDDLLTILKYGGKTNEHFTKLLVNLTVGLGAFADQAFTGGLTILDPMCGRGTTLNQALMYGHHAAGIEIDSKDFDAYGTFLSTWLKDKRFKHEFEKRRDRSGGRDAKVIEARFSADKAAFKKGDVQQVKVVHESATEMLRHFAKESVHAIVCDLPYGVRHGAHLDASLKRSPLEIVQEVLPSWKKVLSPGGTLGLSFNTKTLPRAALEVQLETAGFSLIQDLAGFAHKVDASIHRDLVIASAVSAGFPPA